MRLVYFISLYSRDFIKCCNSMKYCEAEFDFHPATKTVLLTTGRIFNFLDKFCWTLSRFPDTMTRSTVKLIHTIIHKKCDKGDIESNVFT